MNKDATRLLQEGFDKMATAMMAIAAASEREAELEAMRLTMEREDVLLSLAKVSEMLDMHPKTVLQYYHDGRLEGYKVGKKILFEPKDVLAFVRAEDAKSRTVRNIERMAATYIATHRR